MLSKNEFNLLNISNIPNNKEKVERLINIFEGKELYLKEIREYELNLKFGYSYETFRKLLNHSCLIGILNCKNSKYSLSKASIDYINANINFKEYMNSIIDNNSHISNYFNIIYILTRIFSPDIDIKTFYYIFSYISKDRVDDSAIASTGRNLRAVFSLLIMSDRIYKYKNRIFIQENIISKDYCNIDSLSEKFNKDIVNIKDVNKYLNKYFDKKVTMKTLQCLSTYEYENYIWVKGSIYKDNGEIKNLNDEYITTVIIKESEM